MYTKSPFKLGKTSDFIVTRRGQGSFVKGVYTKPAPTTLTLKLLVHPVTKTYNLTFLSDEVKQNKLIRIFSNEELRCKEEKGNEWEADELTYHNEIFRIVSVTPWMVNGYTAYSAYAYKIDSELL